MQVAVGRTVPKGRLPVFSVDTEEEAHKLVTATCSRGLDGKYYAAELVEEQSLENLEKFSDKLQRAHDRFVECGICQCKPVRASRSKNV